MITNGSPLAAMIEAARAAGAVLMKERENLDALDIRDKGQSDFQTSADLRSQAACYEVLARALPDHVLVGEEDEVAKSGHARLLIDPLDGTTNFFHGIPHFSVSIAREVAGELVDGVVFDPSRDELFRASKGEGAILTTGQTERRLTVSRIETLDRALLATGIPNRGGKDHEKYLQALGKIMPHIAGIRRYSSAALDLAYVAAGRWEAYFERGLKAWDLGAGALLVREAGGLVTKGNGEALSLDDGDVFAAASIQIHQALLPMLAPMYAAE